MEKNGREKLLLLLFLLFGLTVCLLFSKPVPPNASKPWKNKVCFFPSLFICCFFCCCAGPTTQKKSTPFPPSKKTKTKKQKQQTKKTTKTQKPTPPHPPPPPKKKKNQCIFFGQQQPKIKWQILKNNLWAPQQISYVISTWVAFWAKTGRP